MNSIKDNDKYIINPKDYRIDWFYSVFLAVFWIIWAPVTVFVTYLAVIEKIYPLYIWLIFGYLGTIMIPVSLYNKNRKQIVEISKDSLTIYGTGVFPGSCTRINRQNLLSLTLEYYDEESVQTLNIFHKNNTRTKRIMLAPLISPKDKLIILEQIKKFLDKHGYAIQVKK